MNERDTCVCCGDGGRRLIGRRALLAGLAAGAASLAFGSTASAGYWTTGQLAAVPGEELRRRPTAADAFALPQPAVAGPPVTGERAGIVRRVRLAEERKEVALTFDLCQTRSPVAGYDGAVVDFLRSQSVPATFFAAGRWLETHRSRAEQLVSDPLFLVGNHSFSHPDLHSAAAERIRSEVLLTEAALAETRARAARACRGTTASAPLRLFRFPFGSCAPAGAATVNAIGSVVIQWDVVSGDPDGTSAKTIVRNVLPNVRPGSIVVMHANGRGTHTAEALAVIVPKLRAAGFRFVTVADLLAAGTPEPATSCYISRPGDTERYDKPVAHTPTVTTKKKA
jgi:peptidoglycan/xylan/chitin deacetylase (PgdA/CDA1 family)